jgi:hypothetical protein
MKVVFSYLLIDAESLTLEAHSISGFLFIPLHWTSLDVRQRRKGFTQDADRALPVFFQAA